MSQVSQHFRYLPETQVSIHCVSMNCSPFFFFFFPFFGGVVVVGGGGWGAIVEFDC